MRFTGAALAAVLACGLVGTARDAAKDGKFVSKDGGFAVRFPAGLDVKTKTQDAPGGLKMVITGGESAKKAYMVMFMALPEGMIKAVHAKAILDGAASGAIAKSGGKEVSRKDFDFGKQKYPARELVVEKDGALVRTHVIVADPKVFVLVVGGPDEFGSSKAATDFLKSFELAPAGKAKTEPKPND